MLVYAFNITTFPHDTSGYRLVAYTEGRLLIEVDGVKFLEATDILLVEFAIVLRRWLSTVRESGPADLEYASMDFEDEPIVALKYDRERNLFELASVWSSSQAPFVTCKEAVSAAEDYLHRLGAELKERYSVEIGPILQSAEDDDGFVPDHQG